MKRLWPGIFIVIITEWEKTWFWVEFSSGGHQISIGFPQDKLPKDPTGVWYCETFTVGGQLVGLRKFEVLSSDGRSIEDAPIPPAPGDAGVPDARRRD